MTNLIDAAAALPARMPPDEAAQRMSEVVRTVRQHLIQRTDPDGLLALAKAAAVGAFRMRKMEASQSASDASRMVMDAMGKTEDEHPLGVLALAAATLGHRI